MGESKLGVYMFGPYMIRVNVDDSDISGAFYMCGTDDKNDLPTIVVGIGHEKHEWHLIVNIVTHELFELMTTLMGFRYDQCPSYTSGNDRFVFHFDHKQMSEIISRVTWSLSPLLEDLYKKFMERFKPKKKRKTKGRR
jgi:hypothetical protein